MLDTITTETLVQRTLDDYAPLLHSARRLPAYTQPEITWTIAPTCAPCFAQRLRAVWATLDLNDRTLFSDLACRLLRYHRFYGLDVLYRKHLSGVDLLRPFEDYAAGYQDLQLCLTTLLGQAFIAKLGPEVPQWFPYHNLSVVPGRARVSRGFSLGCDSLQVHTTAAGAPCYYAAHAPMVSIRGQRRVFAFAPHAIQRIGERLLWSPTGYVDLDGLFGFIAETSYAEPVRLHPDQDAFLLYERCVAPFLSAAYPAAILDQVDPTVSYAYRFAYCPVVADGDFWVAKTVLVPGHVGTPEYGALRQTSLAPGVQERLLAQCEGLSYRRVCDTQDFSLLRWFHRHGVPQVLPWPYPLTTVEQHHGILV